MVALYNATDGANWQNNANWLSDRPLDEWHGVFTDEYGQVIYLDLSANALTGSIPSGLGNLSNLSIIGLARNSLSGPLPTSLGNLSGLTRLSLRDNTGVERRAAERVHRPGQPGTAGRRQHRAVRSGRPGVRRLAGHGVRQAGRSGNLRMTGTAGSLNRSTTLDGEARSCGLRFVCGGDEIRRYLDIYRPVG